MSTNLEEFDLAVRKALASLSPARVENVASLAMSNISADAHLVSTLFRANKKATPQNKISALYLLDAVCRDARARLKKQGKQKEKKPDQDPVEGVDTLGTYSTFLAKVEQILTKFMLDCWENGAPEHRDKVRKVLDIWTKAGTFSAPVLLRISNKLVATSATPAPAPQSPSVPVKSSTAPLEPVVTPGLASTIPANVLALLARQAAAGAVPSVASGSGQPPSNPIPALASLPPLDFALLQQLANATALTSSLNSPSQPQQRPGGAPPQQQQQHQQNGRDGDSRRGSEQQDWNRGNDNGGNYRGNGQGGGGNWNGNSDDRSGSSGGNWGGQQQQNNSFSNNSSWNGQQNNRPPPPQQQQRQGSSMNNEARGSWDQSQRPGEPNRGGGGGNFGNRDGPGRPNEYNQQGGQFNSGTTRRDPPEATNEPPAKRSFPQQNVPSANSSYGNNGFNSAPPPPPSPATNSTEMTAPPAKSLIHPSRLTLQTVRPDLDEFGREKRADAEPDSPPRVYARPQHDSPPLGSASSSTTTFPPPSSASAPPPASPVVVAPASTDDRQLVAQQLQKRIQMQNQAKAAIQQQAQAQMQAMRNQPTPQQPQQSQYQQPQAPPPIRQQPIQQAPPKVEAPVAPFDPASFNCLDPSSWTGFAAMWKAQYGFSPTNEQIMGMVMSTMQQQSQMYGAGAGTGGGAAGYGAGAGGSQGGNQG